MIMILESALIIINSRRNFFTYDSSRKVQLTEYHPTWEHVLDWMYIERRKDSYARFKTSGTSQASEAWWKYAIGNLNSFES
jgi:hypothetical protein